MSDFDLVGGEVAPLAAGKPIKIGNMNGRDRGTHSCLRTRRLRVRYRSSSTIAATWSSQWLYYRTIGRQPSKRP
jgi:hypothetical protein